MADFYYDDIGSARQRFGRKVYTHALDDRGGFRPDQMGIPTDDDVWLEIFEALAEAVDYAKEQPDEH